MMLAAVFILVACASQVETSTASTPERRVSLEECDQLVEAESWIEAAQRCSSFLDQDAAHVPPAHRIRARVGLGVALWHRGGDEKAGAPLQLRQALALVDEGSTKGEGTKARLERYRAMLGGDGANQDLSKLADAVAKARFYIGESVFERFESLQLPAFEPERELSQEMRDWMQKNKGVAASEWLEALRHLPEEERQKQVGSLQFQFWAKQRFTTWMDESTTILAQATKLYLAAFEEDVPEWEMAAAARIGMMNSSMVEDLETAPIDPSVVGDAQLEAIYREALDQAARPYRVQAVEAFERCLEVGRSNQIENQWSRRCTEAMRDASPVPSEKSTGSPRSATGGRRDQAPPHGLKTSREISDYIASKLGAAKSSRCRVRSGARYRWSPGGRPQGRVDQDRFFATTELFLLSSDPQTKLVEVLRREGNVELIVYFAETDLLQVTTKAQQVTLGKGKAAASIKTVPGLEVRDEKGHQVVVCRDIEAWARPGTFDTGQTYNPIKPGRPARPGTKNLLFSEQSTLKISPTGKVFARVGADRSAAVLREQGSSVLVKVGCRGLEVVGWAAKSALAPPTGILGALMGNQMLNRPSAPAETLLYDRPNGHVVGHVKAKTAYMVMEERGGWSRVGVGGIIDTELWIERR